MNYLIYVWKNVATRRMSDNAGTHLTPLLVNMALDADSDVDSRGALSSLLSCSIMVVLTSRVNGIATDLPVTKTGLELSDPTKALL